MPQNSYQEIILVADLPFTWSFSPISGFANLVDNNNVDVLAPGGYTITLPNATLGSPGYLTTFNNIGLLPFDIYDFGGTLIYTVSPGWSVQILLTDSSTSAGIWFFTLLTNGSSSPTNGINNVAITNTDGSIVISGSPLTPPGGAINLGLLATYNNFNALNAIGFPVITSITPNNLTFQVDSITVNPNNNISIVNGNGVAGNPILSLSSTLTQMNSISFPNLVINDSTITTKSGLGLQITSPNGVVSINGVSFQVGGVVSGLTNIIGFSAGVLFTDTPPFGIAVQGSSNIAPQPGGVAGSDGQYTITFSNLLSDTNYGVQFGFDTNPDTPTVPPIYNGYAVTKEVDQVTIVIVDGSGAPVSSVPFGVNVMIISL